LLVFTNVIASEIHGIKNETISKEGLPMIEVLLMFDSDVQDSKYLVAHNIEFDFAVTHAEYKRNNLDTQILSSNNKICTMKASTEFCKIKTKRGYKYPTLQELYQKIFSKTISGSHNSEIDADACMMCFKELYNQKVIKF
jgi:DNA polymerase III epsilon subunit-like protein